jgi:hypothetical protein
MTNTIIDAIEELWNDETVATKEQALFMLLQVIKHENKERDVFAAEDL